jgi:hypothetical protein
VGTAAIGLVATEARAAGAHTVVADTAADNPAAQGAMRRAGFVLAPVGLDGRVHATLEVSTPTDVDTQQVEAPSPAPRSASSPQERPPLGFGRP